MNYLQAPHTVLMVRPVAFGHNEQTASSNAFQQSDAAVEAKTIQEQAVAEFDAMVRKLEAHDIKVMVVEDTPSPVTPDAIFPNNWLSMQPDGKVVQYPMEASNRRDERRADVIERLKNTYQVTELIDLTATEKANQFLEGTGSIIFDHIHKTAYANYSSRTDEQLFQNTCNTLGYRPIGFHAQDQHGQPIYHTNVMMCIGTEFALICLDAIVDDEELDTVLENLNTTERTIIAISYEQMEAFAGNMLEVDSDSGEPYLVMSETAFQSLVNGQINTITQHLEIITIDIPTIEKYGGGSVRCMMAGIHLPKK